MLQKSHHKDKGFKPRIKQAILREIILLTFNLFFLQVAVLFKLY